MMLSAVYAKAQYATIPYGLKPESIIAITVSPSGRTFAATDNRHFATGTQ